MGAAPPVTVLMTVFNGERYLVEAIESVLRQEFADFELLIVDNGSTDATPGLLRELADDRLRIRTLGFNHGRTAALNYALNAARGRYVAILDADDVALPARLGRQYGYLESSPDTVLLGSWYEAIDAEGNHLRTWRAPTAHEALVDATVDANPFGHSTVMFKRSVAVAAGGYPWRYHYSQDAALWIGLLRESRAAVLDTVLVQIRVHAHQFSSFSLLEAEEAIQLQHDALRNPGLSAAARRRGRRALWLRRLVYLRRWVRPARTGTVSA